uniref:Uncharacterized protein n=1 Tax=Oryza meridionalis TaxID=40149 RepID=A0A0E0E3A1_9ORYZ
MGPTYLYHQLELARGIRRSRLPEQPEKSCLLKPDACGREEPEDRCTCTELEAADLRRSC